MDDFPIKDIYKCTECGHTYCYVCLGTHIMQYSNLEPHCFECNVRLMFETIYRALIDYNNSLKKRKSKSVKVTKALNREILNKYILACAKTMCEVDMQKIPLVMPVCKLYKILCKIPFRLELSRIVDIVESYTRRCSTTLDDDVVGHDEAKEAFNNALTTILSDFEMSNRRIYTCLASVSRFSLTRQEAMDCLAEHIGLKEYLDDIPHHRYWNYLGKTPLYEHMFKIVYHTDSNQELGRTIQQRYLFRCERDDCNGYVNNKYVCELCQTKYCSHCWKPLPSKSVGNSTCEQAGEGVCGQFGEGVGEQSGEHTMQSHDVGTTGEQFGEGVGDQSCERSTQHTCKQEDIDTVEVIKSSTRPCPKCASRIQKSQGCSQMFCTNCHTGFDYNTGRIITTNFHNPHRMEWLATLGREQREQHTGECLSVDNRTFNFFRALNWYINQRNDRRDYIRGYDIKFGQADEHNYVRRCKFVIGKLTKEDYEKEFEQMALNLKKLEMLKTIYTEYDTIITDILNEALYYEQDVEKHVRHDMFEKYRSHELFPIIERFFNYSGMFINILQRPSNRADPYASYKQYVLTNHGLKAYIDNMNRKYSVTEFQSKIMRKSYDIITTEIIPLFDKESKQYEDLIAKLVERTNSRLDDYRHIFGIASLNKLCIYQNSFGRYVK